MVRPSVAEGVRACMGEYRVKFEVFEGPLDLLLYLIRREEVDIYEVNLTRIATEFIEYLNLMREFDLDVAGEFVVMAATLMLIKSRELLPRDRRPEGQNAEAEDLEDPRWELIRQLVEYKKFKDAAARLQALEVQAENTFPRRPGVLELPEEPAPRRAEATLFDLLAAVNAVLRRFASREGEARDVFEDKWSVSEKIESLIAAVRERGRLRFGELFHATTSRTEVVVTFLAVLELIRLRMIVAVQPEPFSEIEIEPAPGPSAGQAQSEGLSQDGDAQDGDAQDGDAQDGDAQDGDAQGHPDGIRADPASASAAPAESSTPSGGDAQWN